MVVGIAQVALHLPASRSLKHKRVILKSLKDRIRNKFNVSVAEVDHQDLWQRATLGIVLATNEAGFSDEVMAKIVNIIEQEQAAVLIDYKTEIINASL